MPRITALIRTPAREHSYSLSISRSSTNWFILSQICAGLPSRAKPSSRSISSMTVVRIVSGLNASSSMVSGRAYPVM